MLTLYAHDNGIGVLHVSPRGRGGGRGREGREMGGEYVCNRCPNHYLSTHLHILTIFSLVSAAIPVVTVCRARQSTVDRWGVEQWPYNTPPAYHSSDAPAHPLMPQPTHTNEPTHSQ